MPTLILDHDHQVSLRSTSPNSGKSLGLAPRSSATAHTLQKGLTGIGAALGLVLPPRMSMSIHLHICLPIGLGLEETRWAQNLCASRASLFLEPMSVTIRG